MCIRRSIGRRWNEFPGPEIWSSPALPYWYWAGPIAGAGDLKKGHRSSGEMGGKDRLHLRVLSPWPVFTSPGFTSATTDPRKLEWDLALLILKNTPSSLWYMPIPNTLFLIPTMKCSQWLLALVLYVCPAPTAKRSVGQQPNSLAFGDHL